MSKEQETAILTKRIALLEQQCEEFKNQKDVALAIKNHFQTLYESHAKTETQTTSYSTSLWYLFLGTLLGLSVGFGVGFFLLLFTGMITIFSGWIFGSALGFGVGFGAAFGLVFLLVAGLNLFSFVAGVLLPVWFPSPLLSRAISDTTKLWVWATYQLNSVFSLQKVLELAPAPFLTNNKFAQETISRLWKFCLSSRKAPEKSE
eukprot:TRINITY_DN17849_c0_g1_i1.p1 TRINITY_DN17849_c0_g1~~TRINITY_DN17849_c0_g1_i1.p1  ORF type:complete len:216 (+),score=32.13 TRINITY_DN17849_c0_g1_i1:39-650(+)